MAVVAEGSLAPRADKAPRGFSLYRSIFILGEDLSPSSTAPLWGCAPRRIVAQADVGYRSGCVSTAAPVLDVTAPSVTSHPIREPVW
jgi:hypothetical protein